MAVDIKRQIGEIFEYNRIKLRVEKTKVIGRCDGCYFGTSLASCLESKHIRGESDDAIRTDIGVIFKKVEDMEERTIKLTLEKAKEFYKKGGELRDLALSVYTESELISLPESWDEFCRTHDVKAGECFFDSDGVIMCAHDSWNRIPSDTFGALPNENAAKAHIALLQLHQLRDCYRQGWEPNWNDSELKYTIYRERGELYIGSCCISRFLSFQSCAIANKFLKNFRNLIEQAGDLI